MFTCSDRRQTSERFRRQNTLWGGDETRSTDDISTGGVGWERHSEEQKPHEWIIYRVRTHGHSQMKCDVTSVSCYVTCRRTAKRISDRTGSICLLQLVCYVYECDDTTRNSKDNRLKLSLRIRLDVAKIYLRSQKECYNNIGVKKIILSAIRQFKLR